MSLLLLFNNLNLGTPEIFLKALLEFRGTSAEGSHVRAVAVPWFEILERIRRDPDGAYQINPRTWEEIIAGAYTRAVLMRLS